VRSTARRAIKDVPSSAPHGLDDEHRVGDAVKRRTSGQPNSGPDPNWPAAKPQPNRKPQPGLPARRRRPSFPPTFTLAAGEIGSWSAFAARLARSGLGPASLLAGESGLGPPRCSLPSDSCPTAANWPPASIAELEVVLQAVANSKSFIPPTKWCGHLGWAASSIDSSGQERPEQVLDLHPGELGAEAVVDAGSEARCRSALVGDVERRGSANTAGS